MFDSALYLCPVRDIKLEKRLDVCEQGKRASKITLSRMCESTVVLTSSIAEPSSWKTLENKSGWQYAIPAMERLHGM